MVKSPRGRQKKHYDMWLLNAVDSKRRRDSKSATNTTTVKLYKSVDFDRVKSIIEEGNIGDHEYLYIPNQDVLISSDLEKIHSIIVGFLSNKARNLALDSAGVEARKIRSVVIRREAVRGVQSSKVAPGVRAKRIVSSLDRQTAKQVALLADRLMAKAGAKGRVRRRHRGGRKPVELPGAEIWTTATASAPPDPKPPSRSED